MFNIFLIIQFTTLVVLNIQQISAKLSDSDLKYVSGLDDNDGFQQTLNSVMRPRVVGTDSYKAVQRYIVEELEGAGMSVELDKFQDQTPIFGRLEFANIIARLNPSADKFLTLACHYDSKYFENFDFLGATDSAVPCAQLVNLIQTSMPVLKKLTANSNLGLQLIFFDGEEAFLNWNSRDSLYGSRHLAQKWANQPYKNVREIDRISVLVLLDLLGASNQKFYCTFPKTCKLNKRLSDIEISLKNSQALMSDTKSGKMFQNRFSFAGVDDDHRPFLERNVPVLHLIPSKFPQAWHTQNDNGANLNQRSIANFNRIFRSFVVDYFSQCTQNPSADYCNYN